MSNLFSLQQQNREIVTYSCKMLNIFVGFLTTFGRRMITVKFFGITFQGNLSSGSRLDACEQMYRRTDMTKLIGAFHD
jgi:hypothetical protein